MVISLKHPIILTFKYFSLAISLCFAERTFYTQEVFASAIQTLSEINPIPTLFMRTVIQALSLHPKLINFVLNILQKLISKQVSKSHLFNIFFLILWFFRYGSIQKFGRVL